MFKPVLTRVLIRNELELTEILNRKSIGSPADCWHVIDPADYGEGVQEAIRLICAGEFHLKQAACPQPFSGSAQALLECDGHLVSVGVWELGAKVPCVRKVKESLPALPLGEVLSRVACTAKSCCG